jgi:hypothetical protein
MIAIECKDVVKVRNELRRLLARGGRFDAGVQAFALALAEQLRTEVRSKLDTMPSPAARALSDALVVKAVGKDGAGVFATPTRRQVTIVEHETTLFDVLKRTPVADPVCDYLQAHNPWTFDTLPCVPPTHVAEIIARQAYAPDVAAIRAQKNDAAHARMVQRLGGALRGRDAPIRAADNFAVLVARAELGILTGISPSWKPAIRAVQARAQSTADENWKTVFDSRRNIRRTVDTATASDLKDAADMAGRI